MSSNLRPLKTKTNERVVEELRAILAEAEAGKITGIFFFREDLGGKVTHSRDGMPDATIVFWLELIKRRILEAYE